MSLFKVSWSLYHKPLHITVNGTIPVEVIGENFGDAQNNALELIRNLPSTEKSDVIWITKIELMKGQHIS